MPIYEYRCSSCGHELEAIQKFSDPLLTQCPQCRDGALVKLVSAAGFQLKGGGWYATDFRGSGGKPAGKPAGKSEGTSEGKSESKSESKSEGKSEGKSESKSEGKSEGKSGESKSAGKSEANAKSSAASGTSCD